MTQMALDLTVRDRFPFVVGMMNESILRSMAFSYSDMVYSCSFDGMTCNDKYNNFFFSH